MATNNEILSNAFALGVNTISGRGKVKNKVLYSYDSVLAYWKDNKVYVNTDIGGFSQSSKRLMNTLTETLDFIGIKYILTESNEVVVKHPMKCREINTTATNEEIESIDSLIEEVNSLTRGMEEL